MVKILTISAGGTYKAIQASLFYFSNLETQKKRIGRNFKAIISLIKKYADYDYVAFRDKQGNIESCFEIDYIKLYDVETESVIPKSSYPKGYAKSPKYNLLSDSPLNNDELEKRQSFFNHRIPSDIKMDSGKYALVYLKNEKKFSVPFNVKGTQGKEKLELVELPEIPLVNEKELSSSIVVDDTKKTRKFLDIKSPQNPLNQILFGPPGTGKTYNTVNMALDIVCPEGSQWEKEPRDKARKEYQKMQDAGQIVFVTFHQSMSYEDFIEGIKPKTEDGKITYEVKDGIFKKLCEKAKDNNTQITQNYVMIIDEINRGNVANIFGELISLIEDDKRLGASEELHAELPYSHTIFGVPKNVYIIGTMNTADRSVEALDSALRRRFTFKEMMPKAELVPEENNVRSIFEIINQRIEVLKDREHQIGHSYFMGVEKEDDLKGVFYDKIIPLLQEYFYGDYEKIQLVLGEGFVKKESESVKFAGDKSGDFDVSEVYRIVPKDKCNMDEAIGKLLNKASKAVDE